MTKKSHGWFCRISSRLFLRVV